MSIFRRKVKNDLFLFINGLQYFYRKEQALILLIKYFIQVFHDTNKTGTWSSKCLFFKIFSNFKNYNLSIPPNSL